MRNNLLEGVGFAILVIVFLILVWIFPDNLFRIKFWIALFGGIITIIYVLFSFHKGKMPVTWLKGRYKISREEDPQGFWFYFVIELTAGIVVVILSLVGLFLIR